METKSLLYIITFAGLYLEMSGAFLLSIEAIGYDNLMKVAIKIRKKRILFFIILLILIVLIVLLSSYTKILHLPAVIILLISFGMIYDFSPKLIEIIVNRFQKGTAGIIGFIFFSTGFILQGYVSLSLLF